MNTHHGEATSNARERSRRATDTAALRRAERTDDRLKAERLQLARRIERRRERVCGPVSGAGSAATSGPIEGRHPTESD